MLIAIGNICLIFFLFEIYISLRRPLIGPLYPITGQKDVQGPWPHRCTAQLWEAAFTETSSGTIEVPSHFGSQCIHEGQVPEVPSIYHAIVL